MGRTAERNLDWKSGGWILALAVALTLAAAVWRIGSWRLSEGAGAIGDGTDPATYGFDLTDLDPALDRALLVGSRQPRDGIPALVDPPAMTAEELAAFNAAHRGKFVVAEDLVIGVALGGEARAYPLRLLDWHEVAHDTLGGRPIAVTWHPLCGSAAVYDRRVGGRTLEFGLSGLLWSSNALLYDRGGESLWLQLAGRAVSGPARGTRLTPLPASLVRWDAWLAAHPETTVVRPDPARLKRYQENVYGNYRLTGQPRFPTVPLPEGAGAAFDPLAIVGAEAPLRVVELDPDGAPPADGWPEAAPPATFGGDGLRATVLLGEASGSEREPAPVRYAYRFAARAQLGTGAGQLASNSTP